MTTNKPEIAGLNKSSGWQEFWSKEDWWAVWLGLGIVIVAYAFYLAGSSISWIAVAPAKWSSLSQFATQFSTNAVRYVALLGAFLILFTIVISFIGQKLKAFIPSFIFVFILSTIIYAAGNWDQANRYNLEPPLVALVLGLIISNVIGMPRWLDAGFRVECLPAPLGAPIETWENHGVGTHCEGHELAAAAEFAELLQGPGVRFRRASGENFFVELLTGERRGPGG